MLEVSTRHSHLIPMLQRHPHIAAVTSGSQDLAFGRRSVSHGTDGEVSGIVEIMDNNPLVCAQAASTPGLCGTLASLALGPILISGLVVEPPVVLFSFEEDEQDVLRALEALDYKEGATMGSDPHDLGSVRGIYCVAKIRNLADFSELDAIYAERYEKSFFMRLATFEEWNVELVKGQAFAAYRLELTVGEEESLLSIHVMGDISGRIGDAGLIHMMNVMCGFEESLGLV